LFFSFTPYTKLYGVKCPTIIDTEGKTLFQNGIGYITAFAAREGFESVDKGTLSEYLEKAKNYLREETNGRDEDYLKTKIINKKKKYNKA
jgi:hypothetical protein